MSESSERETEAAAEAADRAKADSSATPGSDANPNPPHSALTSDRVPPDSKVVSDPSWDDVTPPRRTNSFASDPALKWSASEVTLVTPPLVPEDDRNLPLPAFYSEPEVHAETSGTRDVPGGRVVSPRTPAPAGNPHDATRAGIELGRPVFAVAAIGALAALGALFLAGTQAAAGVAIGATTATLNLWGFTRIGTAFFSRRGMRASWGVLAGLKLIALFGIVGVMLKMEIADPVSFLVGYVALPVGIVASQLLGLQPDFEEL
jgi:ATP synthase I chain